MRVAALLTGRGGSSMRDKNVRMVLGRPLLAYAADAAAASRYVSSLFVSSDDKKILDAAARCGYTKILRPGKLSRPSSQHRDVIIHALGVMKDEYGEEPDILVVLLANTACVKTEWVDGCIKEVIEEPGLSAVVPVCEDLDHHPFRAKKINDKGLLDTFFDFGGKKVSTNRQDLEPSYFLCHNFWVLNVKRSVYAKGGQKPWDFMGSRVKPFMVEECHDVHDEEDLLRTEKWLKKNLSNYKNTGKRRCQK